MSARAGLERVRCRVFWFQRILQQRMHHYLAWLLSTRGLRVFARVMAEEEDNKFKVCVTAERWEVTFEEQEQEHFSTPSIDTTLVWGLTFACHVLSVDSLETEAALVMAKALSAGQGEEGLTELELPEKLQKLVVEFMDKEEKLEGGRGRGSETLK